MKTLPSVAAFALALSVVVPAAHAGNTILQEHTKGQQAVADFGTDTPIDCGDGFEGSFHVGITLLANELVQRSDFFPQVLDQIEIFLFTRNSCTGESGFGSGVVPGTNKNLHWSSTNKATMSGSVAISDFFTEVPMGTVAFDLRFTGVGQSFRSQSHQQLEFPPFRFVTHSVGSFRSASVSGTITLDGEEFLDNIGSASLGKSRSGTIQMTRE